MKFIDPSKWTQTLTKPEYKIYSLLAEDSQYKNGDKTRLPVDIDFKTGLNTSLYKEVSMVDGAPVSKTYYTDAVLNQNGSVTYTNPIVKIEYEFERDSISLVIRCIQRFRWYDTEGNLSTECKAVPDLYNTVEKMAEATQRRGNIIADLKVKTIYFLMISENLPDGISQPEAAELGRPFLSAYKPEIIDYIDEANESFATAVTNASSETYPWLENNTPYQITIRQFIINAIS